VQRTIAADGAPTLSRWKNSTMATDVKTNSDPERAPRSRLSGAARRERFLDMAAEIIVQSGLAPVPMESVARRAYVDKRLG